MVGNKRMDTGHKFSAGTPVGMPGVADHLGPSLGGFNTDKYAPQIGLPWAPCRGLRE